MYAYTTISKFFFDTFGAPKITTYLQIYDHSKRHIILSPLDPVSSATGVYCLHPSVQEITERNTTFSRVAMESDVKSKST